MNREFIVRFGLTCTQFCLRLHLSQAGIADKLDILFEIVYLAHKWDNFYIMQEQFLWSRETEIIFSMTTYCCLCDSIMDQQMIKNL